MFRQFINNRRAGVAIAFAVILVPVLAAIGMAMEYANIISHRAKLQNSVDAAILFAGSYLDQTDALPPDTDIKGFVAANYHAPISAMDFKRTHAGSRLTLKVETKVPAYFFGDIYPRAFDHKISASIPYLAKNYFEIAMVLDNTGSMENNNAGVTSATDNKMIVLKEVANKFVDDLAAIADAKNKMNVGLVPFSRYVNVGTHNAAKSWIRMTPTVVTPWTGCVGTRPPGLRFVDGSINVQFPAFNYSHCPSPIAKLADVTASSSNAIKGSINAMKAGGLTYIGTGVMWGLRVLSSQEPFSEGLSFGSLAAHINHQKVMLVLTDGDNIVGPFPTGNSFYHDDTTLGVPDDATKSACKEARDAGVIIFTIVFGQDFGAWGSNAEQVMRECAGDDIRYFRAEDYAALRAAFNSIFAQLTNLRLTS